MQKEMEYLIAFHNGPEICVIIYYQMWLLKASGVPGVLHEFQLRAVIESRIHLAGQFSGPSIACLPHRFSGTRENGNKQVMQEAPYMRVMYVNLNLPLMYQPYDRNEIQ